MKPVTLLAFLMMTLVGCQQEHASGPPGQITLSYDGTSAGRARFLLDNRSMETITFQASKFFAGDAEPWNTSIFCMQASEGSIGLFPPLDYDFHPKLMSIRPEERLHVSYPKDLLAMSGTCHLEITLSAERNIRSNDFKP
jgi:hypothetical protein